VKDAIVFSDVPNRGDRGTVEQFDSYYGSNSSQSQVVIVILTTKPHRRSTRTVQSHSPGGANVHPHLTHNSLGPSESILQTASRSVKQFLHSLWQTVLILYNGPHFSCLKIVPSHWFPGPTRVHIANGISIGSAVFAGLTIVTDRQTDRPTDRPRYSACKSRPHLRT